MDIAACFAFASRGVIDLIGFIIDIPSETHPGTRPLPPALRREKPHPGVGSFAQSLITLAHFSSDVC
jgi:hypothetical protein